MKKRILGILLIISMLFIVASCGNNEGDKGAAIDLTKDREGNTITLPEKIEKIICIGPSNTEILIGLGVADKIVASDTYSENVSGLKTDIPLFDMMALDTEQILNLTPDLVFITGMSKAGEEDPYKAIKEAGTCVIYIPSSKTIQAIEDDISYMAAVVGAKDKGKEIVNNMEKEIEAIKKIADKITEKKSIYFEIGAAPYMYSFGTGVYLNEMIELIGAKNALSDQKEWIAVTDEVILTANPDVILTNVNYAENPTEEIKTRAGWADIKAVANNQVFSIDTDASSRPSQNIINTLKEMAKTVYPDQYK